MDNQPLHPNLARLAAAYDEVLRRFSLRQLDAPSARAAILALQARDDEGIVWTVDPDTGDWKRQTRTGNWVVATPPREGLATLTAHDLSRDPRLFNPDTRIRFDEAAVPVNGLHGSIKGKVGVPAPAAGSSSKRASRGAVAAIVAALVAAAAWMMLSSDGDTDASSPATPVMVPADPVVPDLPVDEPGADGA